MLLKFVAIIFGVPSSVQRRVRQILTRWRGLTGTFNGPSLKSSLRLACAPAPDRDSASKKAVTADILALLLQACAGERLVDLRDRALLLTTFASGGRRRSEIAGLQVADLVDEESIRDDPNDANSLPFPQREIAKSGSALGSAAKVVHLKTTKMYPNLSFNPSVPDVKLLPVAWRRQFHGER